MLPSDFVFSQNNLQKYVDCKRLFYLQEIEHLEWPAIESEPVRNQEERMAVGSRFHLLCSQYLLGIPEELLRESIDSEEVKRWWNSFLKLGLQPSPGVFPEKAITVPFGNFRLTAHFDLLIKESDRTYVIYDWKTNQHQPKRDTIENRMQTLVYPVVLSRFLDPDQTQEQSSIDMIYWYPEFPDQPHKFRFHREGINYNQQTLEMLIAEISTSDLENFVMTDNQKRCKICPYRSFCNRGIKAGEISEIDMLEEPTILV
jgi:hypothetical protein